MKGDDCNKRCVEHTRQELFEKGEVCALGIKLPSDLTSAEENLVKDQVLDKCSALEFAVRLIGDMREAENKNDYHFIPHSCLGNLKKFLDASPSSDYGKAAQAAKNNGDLLTKAINLASQKHVATSEKLRTEVINNLEWWILDSSYFRSVKKNTPREKEIRDFEVSCLTLEHFQEIRKLMINDIKATATEWKIAKEVGWLDEETGEEWYVELVLRNVKKPHRRFNIRTFAEEEWEEIKKVVKNHQCRDLENEYLSRGSRWENPNKNGGGQEENPTKNGNKTKNQQGKKPKEYGKIILFGIVIFSVVIAVLIFGD